MHDLQLVGFTTDRRGLIFRPRAGARSDASFVVPVTDELVALVAEIAAEQADAGPTEAELEVERVAEVAARAASQPRSQLSVRDIQARLRAGEPVARVAAEAGVDDDWIERFAPPIRAEQRRIIDQALEHHLRRSRSADSAAPLRRAVGMSLADKGIAYTLDAFEAAWSAHLLGQDRWAVSFTYRHRGRDRTATWAYDAAADELTTTDRTASQLGYVAPGAAREDDGQAVDGIVGDPEAKTQIGTASADRRARATTGGRSSRATSSPPRSTGTRSSASTTGGTTKAAGARTASKKASAKKSAAKKAAAKKSASKAAAAKKAASKAAAAKQAASKKSAAKKTATKKTATKKTATKKTAADKKAAAKKSPARKTSTRKTAAKRSPSKKAASKKSSSKKAASKESASRKKPAAPRSAPETSPPTPAWGTADAAAQAAVAPAPSAPDVGALAAPSVVTDPSPASAASAPAPVPAPSVASPAPADPAPARPAPPAPRSAPGRLADDAARPEPRRRAAPAPASRPVAGRPGEVPIGDVPLAGRPPTGNGRAAPDADPAPTDPAAERRARAAERHAPTVQFRSGSAAPVRAAGTGPDGTIRRSPEPDRPRPDGSRSNGAADPATRRRRQLRAR